MRSSDLFSKEWCDLVFEGRNKEYGAYKLRERTGTRYRCVYMVLLGFVLIVGGMFGGAALFKYYLRKQGLEDAEEAFLKKPRDLKEGYEVKFVKTARLAPNHKTTPGAKSAELKIVEGNPMLDVIGTEGPIDYDPGQEVVLTPIVDTTDMNDEKLLVAKQKIVPTEQISQLPEFPGGLRAFMNWLNEKIVYPPSCRDRHKEGVVMVTFIIDTEGYAIEPEVKNAFDRQIEQSIMRALKSMPKWKPGTNELGQLTPVRLTIPVEFKL